MQYALFKVSDDTMVLLDANEWSALERHGDKIADVSEDEDSMPLKLVYGAYMPNQEGRFAVKDADGAVLRMAEAKGYALGHVKGDSCRAIELCDFISYEPICSGHSIRIPFAALIRTHVEMPTGDSQAVTAFLRYGEQMTPGTNVLNRPGLFAFKAQERRPKEPVGQENWRAFVDVERAARTARNVV